jgi:hypothetical protein
MVSVFAQEEIIYYSLQRIVCPLNAVNVYFIKCALEKAIEEVFGDKSLVGAFAIDWQDYSGRVIRRVACFNLAHNYDPEYPTHDLRDAISASINVVSAVHINDVLGWKRHDKLLYAVPEFLEKDGTHIPMGISGMVVLTMLSTAHSWDSEKIIKAVEQDFHGKWNQTR